MSQEQKTSKRLVVVNTLGVLGYLSALLQWAWAVLIVGYPLLESRPVILFPEASTVKVPATDFGSLSPVVTFVVLAMTAAILIVCAVMIARLPKTIGKQGARVTHGAARKLTPVVMRHTHSPKKDERTISRRLVLIIKACLVLLPLVITCFARPLEDVTLPIIWTIALFCAFSTLAYFAAQQLVAKVFGVRPERVW